MVSANWLQKESILTPFWHHSNSMYGVVPNGTPWNLESTNMLWDTEHKNHQNSYHPPVCTDADTKVHANALRDSHVHGPGTSSRTCLEATPVRSRPELTRGRKLIQGIAGTSDVHACCKNLVYQSLVQRQQHLQRQVTRLTQTDQLHKYQVDQRTWRELDGLEIQPLVV
jgi:hypothetical protein